MNVTRPNIRSTVPSCKEFPQVEMQCSVGSQGLEEDVDSTGVTDPNGAVAAISTMSRGKVLHDAHYRIVCPITGTLFRDGDST